jgi:hypothetical protein
VRFRLTGRLGNQVMVLVYSGGKLVGGTADLKSRLADRPISGPREALGALEEALDRVDDLELLESDFLPPDDSDAVPIDFYGGVTHLVTRLVAAKRAATTYSQVLEWQEQGLLHPVRLNFASRPEVFYSHREVDDLLSKLKITPRQYVSPEVAVPPPSLLEEATLALEAKDETERLQAELLEARAAAEREKGHREALAEQLAHERQEKEVLIKALLERPRWWWRRTT